MRKIRQLALALALPACGGLALFSAVAARAEIVDRLVATVGKQVVTLSDVEQEYAAQSFLEGKQISPLDAAQIRDIANRLVDQALMRQEMQGAVFPRAAPEQAEAQMQGIRRRFSDGPAYRAALERYGLREDVLRRRFQFQADLFNFIDYRFRPSAQVLPDEIDRFYRDVFLPEVRRQGAREPSLDQVHEKIAALLVERRINQLLSAWMKDLRGQAEIRLR